MFFYVIVLVSLLCHVGGGAQVVTLHTAQVGLHAAEADVALGGVHELEVAGLDLDEVLLVFPAAATDHFALHGQGVVVLGVVVVVGGDGIGHDVGGFCIGVIIDDGSVFLLLDLYFCFMGFCFCEILFLSRWFSFSLLVDSLFL